MKIMIEEKNGKKFCKLLNNNILWHILFILYFWLIFGVTIIWKLYKCNNMLLKYIVHKCNLNHFFAWKILGHYWSGSHEKYCWKEEKREEKEKKGRKTKQENQKKFGHFSNQNIYRRFITKYIKHLILNYISRFTYRRISIKNISYKSIHILCSWKFIRVNVNQMSSEFSGEIGAIWLYYTLRDTSVTFVNRLANVQSCQQDMFSEILLKNKINLQWKKKEKYRMLFLNG